MLEVSIRPRSMSPDRPTPEDEALARIALRMGFVDADILRTALGAPSDAPLLDQLLTAGALTADQVALCRRTHAFTTFREASLREAEPLVRRHAVPDEAVRRLLEYQKLRFLKAGERLSLVDLLRREQLLPEVTPPATPRPSPVPRTGAEGSPATADAPGARADSGFVEPTITVSEDRLQAIITRPPEGRLSPRAIRRQLEHRHIQFGVVDDAALWRWCAGDAPTLVLAQGEAAEPSVDGFIEYHFDTAPLQVGEARDDGTVDFAEKGEVPVVAAGTLLARRVPAVRGRAGRTIHGEPIPAAVPREAALKRGRKVRYDEDLGALFAEVEGQPALLTDGRVVVFPRYVIDGDVDLGSGHVDYEGVVVVRGEVRPGFRVECGKLLARGVHRAEVVAEGDVTIDGGVVGARLRVGGTLRARFVHDSDIECRGDVIVQREIIDSRIDTSGQVSLRQGRLLSSRVRARQGVAARDIGAGNAQPCVLQVGFDDVTRNALERLRSARAEALEAARDARRRVALREERVRRATEPLAALLREDAEDRELLDTFRAERDKASADEREQLERMLRPTQLRADARAESVAAARKRIAEAEAALAEAVEAVDAADAAARDALSQMAEMRDWEGTREGTPKVWAAGRLEAQTRIKAPHTERVVSKDLEKVLVIERVDPRDAARFVLDVRTVAAR